MRIAVAGATGVVGTHVVEEVRRAGHEPVSLARSLGVDVSTGKGLAEALAGVDIVVDVLSTKATGKGKAQEFFETTTTNLLRAEQEAGVRHHVALSIVGIDGVPFGYYRAKVAPGGARRGRTGAVDDPAGDAVPRVRAEQVLDLFGDRLIALVPSMLSQPIAAVEVAEPLVAAATAARRSYAGPRRSRATTDGCPWRARSPVRPGDASWCSRCTSRDAAGQPSGKALAPDADGPRGRATFDEWLTRTLPGHA